MRDQCYSDFFITFHRNLPDYGKPFQTKTIPKIKASEVLKWGFTTAPAGVSSAEALLALCVLEGL